MEDALALSIRPAIAGDYAQFVRLFRELAVDDPVPGEFVWNAVLRPQTIFAEGQAAPVGYGMCEVHKNVGYVRHLAVDPVHRRRGIGRRLMEAMARRLRTAGCDTWRLNVRIENAPARRLYEDLGLKVAYRSTALRIQWDVVGALPASKRPWEVESIQPDADAALEARFDLPPGQLAEHRARQGQVLLRIGEPEVAAAGALGVASFDPSFPGAFPFRVADSAAARGLLEAMRAYARPADAEVNLVIEDDEKTAAILRAAGAKVRMEVFHYRGDLPAIPADERDDQS